MDNLREVNWQKSYSRLENFMFYPSDEVVRYVARNIRKKISDDEFIDIIPGAKDSQILDLGCGIGRHLIFAHEMGLRAFGLDLSELAVKIARARLTRCGVANAQSRVIGGDARKLPWSGAFFDHAISDSVLDSMPFSIAVDIVRDLARVLKPGGSFYLSLISGDQAGFPVDFDGEIEVTEQHEYGTIQSYFNEAKILRLLEPYFTISRCEQVTHRNVQSGHWHGRWHITAICREKITQ